MSKPVDSHSAAGRLINVPGVGTVLAIYATTTEAGTFNFAPGGLLLTTTTNKVYVNTGTAATASWTVVGTQS